MLAICQWIQETRLSAAIAESTWGFPLIAALHVLAMALFGGAVLLPHRSELGTPRWTGLTVLLATGLLLFWSQPLRCYHSTAFWWKMALLALLGVVRPAGKSAWGVWAGVILASRGIAFF